MNTRARVAWSEARRHPREARRVTTIVGRHPKAALRAIKLVRRAMRLTRALRGMMADPKAQAEARSALADLTSATRRVRKVGLAQALGDKQVRRELQRASSHGSRSVALARRAQRRRSVGVRLTATLAAGALSGAAYLGFNRYVGVHPTSIEVGREAAPSAEH